MAKRVTTFTLDSETDRDIVRWLERQDNKSAAIRKAIREHIGGAGVTLGDIYQAVKDLERKVAAGVAVIDSASLRSIDDNVEEPPDAAAALDALANL
jgi:hypothetical protein